MTRFDDLDRALTAYFDIEAVAPAPAGLLESAMTTTARRRPRPSWLARARSGSPFAMSPGGTGRTLLIAAALVALLLGIVGFALIGGSPPTKPLLGDVTPSATSPSTPSPSPVASGPADDALRATWVAETGAGLVEMTVAGSGTSLLASNLILGGSYDSSISQPGDGTIELTLDRATGDCEAGAVGRYQAQLNAQRDLLTLVPGDDACPARSEALGRTWARSLIGGTTEGSGFVTSMSVPFRVDLPDQPLVARTLPDMVEIAGDDGFSLMAFRNPQGFADACSTDEERVPYTPGAAAFADFLEQNPSLDVTSREELTVGGQPAIHVVTEVRSVADGAPCEEPAEGLYVYTPQDCACHFLGGHDSYYIVDLPNGDTMMFEVSPVDATNPLERQVIDTIEIPASLPFE
jgi:hypothetical protein